MPPTLHTPPGPARKLGSSTETRGYRVDVEPAYDPEQSDASGRRYVFKYKISITNVSGVAATLRTRHWRIVDALGRESEVRGDGVIGKTPRLEPGRAFTYDSYCPITTPWGTMEGSYGFTPDEGQGEPFEVRIGRFYLVAPTERTPLPA